MTDTTRKSIEPTYDSEETGPRFEIETRINGRVISVTALKDPFVTHRVVIGWRDVLGFLLRGREVWVRVDGVDRGIVEDVCELDADYAGSFGSTRRAEWRDQIEGGLRRMAESGGGV